jgi:hypothetical protein
MRRDRRDKGLERNDRSRAFAYAYAYSPRLEGPGKVGRVPRKPSRREP